MFTFGQFVLYDVYKGDERWEGERYKNQDGVKKSWKEKRERIPAPAENRT